MEHLWNFFDTLLINLRFITDAQIGLKSDNFTFLLASVCVLRCLHIVMAARYVVPAKTDHGAPFAMLGCSLGSVRESGEPSSEGSFGTQGFRAETNLLLLPSTAS